MPERFGLISEDNSDIEVIRKILLNYFDDSDFSVKKFVGNGCGKIKQKCAAWTENLLKRGCDHVLIFHDSDNNPTDIIRTLLQNKLGNHCEAVIIIPIQEIEAWLLSDANAIRTTFNLKRTPKKIHNTESIISPKEYLRDLVWRHGRKPYINTIHNARIAENIALSNFRRCPSFRPLHNYLVSI